LSRTRGRFSPCLPFLGLLALAIFIWPCCYADFDVNAVVGVVTVGGVPASRGSLLGILDHENGFTFITDVDGENVPPFLKGQGRYDTGDVSAFSTGDTVTVFLVGMEEGSVSITLQGGTNVVNLSYEYASELGAVSGTSSSAPASLPGTVDRGPSEAVQARSSLPLGSVERWIPRWIQSLVSSVGPLILGTVALVLLGSVSYLAVVRRRAASSSGSAPGCEDPGKDSDSF